MYLLKCFRSGVSVIAHTASGSYEVKIIGLYFIYYFLANQAYR